MDPKIKAMFFDEYVEEGAARFGVDPGEAYPLNWIGFVIWRSTDCQYPFQCSRRKGTRSNKSMGTE